MSYTRNKLARFKREAERGQTSNYGGDFMGGDYAGKHDYFMNGGYVGGQDYYNGNGGGSPQGGGLSEIPPFDRTLTVNIVNSNTGSGSSDATVFSAYKNPSLSQPSGISVNILETGHEQVREESKSQPFYVLGFKYVVSNSSQFTNNLSLEYQTAAGGTQSYNIQPLSFRSAQNQINTQIDSPAFGFPVTGRTTLTIPTNTNEDITLILYIKSAVDMGNVLKGQNALGFSDQEFITGLPQFDIRRMKGGA